MLPHEAFRIGCKVTFIAAGIVLAAAFPAFSQSTGVVEGRIVDQTGDVLPGVSIDLASATTIRHAVSDGSGAYRFDGVPAGSAEISFRLINYAAARRAIVVAPGTATPVNAVLWLALSGDVIVSAPKTFRNLADAIAPAESLVGLAASASQGAITAAQLEARPIMRAGEVLETVPGMIVSQHSGEGKANQYYLRGFNLDHGTDFSTTVAGVPVNTPSGAHAHGWMDLNFLIPELVSGIQFKKGPYFADEGDFSAAGASNINYFNRLDQPLVSVSAGNNGWGRMLGAASPMFKGGHLLAAIEVNHHDGPWVRPDDYGKLNGVLRYSRGHAQNGFSLTAMAYGARWNSTDQVPARAVASGAIPRLGLIDPSDHGTARRESVSADFQRSIGAASLRASGFVLRNQLNLFSNFTYFLSDPVHGDQFEQAERRLAAGGRVTYRRLGRMLGRHSESSAGAQLRRDHLAPVGLYQTSSGRRRSTTREDRVEQTTVGAFGQTEVEWTRWFRSSVGLRVDRYGFSVSSFGSPGSRDGSDGIVSPKFGAVFGPWSGTEVYANAGTGFHSNDARSAVSGFQPAMDETARRIRPLVRAKGAEAGLRTVRWRGLQSTVSIWYLALDSELLFVGDAGTTEAGRPSRRAGVEWTNYWRPRAWLTADLDVAWSRARFADDDTAGNRIPGAPDRVASAGFTFKPGRPVFGTLRVRHFGPRPLIEDASVKSGGTTLWNGELGLRFSPKVRLVLEGFNLFDSEVADVDYFYTSRLPGEPASGVEDVHTHPALPRSIRARLIVEF